MKGQRLREDSWGERADSSRLGAATCARSPEASKRGRWSGGRSLANPPDPIIQDQTLGLSQQDSVVASILRVPQSSEHRIAQPCKHTPTNGPGAFVRGAQLGSNCRPTRKNCPVSLSNRFPEPCSRFWPGSAPKASWEPNRSIGHREPISEWEEHCDRPCRWDSMRKNPQKQTPMEPDNPEASP